LQPLVILLLAMLLIASLGWCGYGYTRPTRPPIYYSWSPLAFVIILVLFLLAFGFIKV
jgi:hypothetical protein